MLKFGDKHVGYTYRIWISVVLKGLKVILILFLCYVVWLFLVTVGLHFADLSNGMKHVLQYDKRTVLYTWQFCPLAVFCLYVFYVALLCSNVYSFYGWNILCSRISYFYWNFGLLTVEVKGSCVIEIMLIRVFYVIFVHCF